MKRIFSLVVIVLACTNGLVAQNVGIGTTTPATKLHVYDPSASAITTVETGSNLSAGGLLLKTPGGSFNQLQIYKWGSSASGSQAGINLTNLSQVMAGASAANLMIGTTGNYPLHFVTNNIERMRLAEDGTLRINSNSNFGLINAEISSNSKAVLYAQNNITTGTSYGIDAFITSPAGAAFGGATYNNGGVSPIELNNYAFVGQAGDNGIAMGAYSLAGISLRAKSNTGYAISAEGKLQFTNNGEGNNKVLTSDALGNATWKDFSSVDSTWILSGDNLYNHNLNNVGIGTVTPATKLDVKSSSSYVAQFNGAASMYMGIFENDIYRGYWGSYAGAAEDVDFGTGSGNATGKLHLTIQASPKLTINAAGYVGIGTTSPNHKLHINGGDLFVQSSSGLIRFGYEGGNEWQMATTGGGADLRWYTTVDGGTSIIPRHYFSQNGNVGIGGFSGGGVPLGRLDVIGSGATSTTNTFLLRNSDGDTLMRMRDDGKMGIGYNGGTYGRTLNLGGNGLNFFTPNTSLGGAVFPTDTSLVLWSNSGSNNYLVMQPIWGNTGIGTYSPNAKLHVNGTVILGSQGSVINNVLRVTSGLDIPSIAAGVSSIQTFTLTGVTTTSSVSISPSAPLPNGLVIAYARGSAAGTVEVKFTNTTAVALDPAFMNFYITAIQ